MAAGKMVTPGRTGQTPKHGVQAHKPAEQTPREEVATLEERIRLRAYEIYLARGDGPGSDVEDWLQAEHELMGERSTAA